MAIANKNMIKPMHIMNYSIIMSPLRLQGCGWVFGFEMNDFDTVLLRSKIFNSISDFRFMFQEWI